MQLYVTLTSPYARIVRVLIIEKGLEDRVAVTPAVTRTAESPYYAVNPSGRVPALVDDDGALFEGSDLICAYLDTLEDPPILKPQTDWPARRLEARARGMLDGLAVWGREFLYRSDTERSPTIIAHETTRALRLAAAFDESVADGDLDGPLDMAQITLGCTLHNLGDRLPGFEWRKGNARLAAWVEAFGARDSMQRTLPPN